MILVCIKQHLSNIWGSIHEKVKQHWGWPEKNVAYQKKRVPVLNMDRYYNDKIYNAFFRKKT